MKLTWRKKIARLRPALHELRIDGCEEPVAIVQEEKRGVFWYTFNRPDWLPFRNTSDAPAASVAEAKRAAAFVREHAR